MISKFLSLVININFLKAWKRSFLRVFSIFALFIFLAVNVFQPQLLDLSEVQALHNGISVNFDDTYTSNLGFNAYSSVGAGSVTAKAGVYHCSGESGANCLPPGSLGGQSPDYLATLKYEDFNLQYPADNVNGSRGSVSVPSVPGNCGRVQVDIGTSDGSGGIYGGQTYRIGGNCQAAPPPGGGNPPPAPAPNPCPTAYTGVPTNLRNDAPRFESNGDIKVMLRWDQPAGATKYNFRLDDPRTPGSAPGVPDIQVDNIGGDSREVTLRDSGVTYNWWLHAGNDCGFGAPASSSFTVTAAPAPGPCTPEKPGAPTVSASQFRAQWNAMPRATVYNVRLVQPGGSADSPKAYAGTSNTWFDFPAADVSAPGTYSGWVDAANACGHTGGPFSFTVAGGGPGPGPTNPTCGTINVSPTTVNLDNNQDVSFNGSINNAPAGASYTWVFGDGTSGNGLQATHRYTSAGSYGPILRVIVGGAVVLTCPAGLVVVNQAAQPGLNLNLDKVTNTPTVQPGEEASFTLTLTNNSGRRIDNIRVTDTLPSGFSYTSASRSPNSTPGNQVIWSNIGLNNGDSWSVTLRANSPQTANTYTNQAVAEVEGRSFPDSSQVRVVSDDDLDFDIDKYVIWNGQQYENLPASTHTFAPGETITFRIRVRNTSDVRATRVRVEDNVPAHLDITSQGNGTVNGRQIVWDLGTMNAGETETVEFTTTVRSDIPAGQTPVTNVVAVSGRDPDNDTIQGPTDQAIAVVSRTAQGGEPVVTVEKTVNNGAESQTVSQGAEVTFRIRITNNTGRDLTGVSVIDDLPDGFSYVDNSTTGSTTSNPSISGRTLTWSGISLPIAATWEVSFRSRASNTAGTHTNQARATAEGRSFGPDIATVTVTQPGTTTTGTGGGPVNVFITMPGQPGVAGVQSLPKTGLPVAMWAAAAFIPAGLRMRKFSRNHRSDTHESAHYMWEVKQYYKSKI